MRDFFDCFPLKKTSERSSTCRSCRHCVARCRGRASRSRTTCTSSTGPSWSDSSRRRRPNTAATTTSTTTTSTTITTTTRSRHRPRRLFGRFSFMGRRVCVFRFGGPCNVLKSGSRSFHRQATSTKSLSSVGARAKKDVAHHRMLQQSDTSSNDSQPQVPTFFSSHMME